MTKWHVRFPPSRPGYYLQRKTKGGGGRAGENPIVAPRSNYGNLVNLFSSDSERGFCQRALHGEHAGCAAAADRPALPAPTSHVPHRGRADTSLDTHAACTVPNCTHTRADEACVRTWLFVRAPLLHAGVNRGARLSCAEPVPAGRGSPGKAALLVSSRNGSVPLAGGGEGRR